MERVYFNHEFMKQAWHYVSIREQESVGLKDNHGMRRGDYATEKDRQLRGVLGEWATANVLDLPYQFTVNTFKAPDVVLRDGRGIQVKCSMKEGPLVVRRDAKDKHVYVLTWMRRNDNGTAVVCVVGWITAYEARLLADCEPSYWQDPLNRHAPAIFIPSYILRDINTLEDGRTDVGLYGLQRQPNIIGCA